MIDTLHLLPPDLGPRSNPTLYGVAEAIAELFPLAAVTPHPREDEALEPGAIAPAQAPAEVLVAG